MTSMMILLVMISASFAGIGLLVGGDVTWAFGLAFAFLAAGVVSGYRAARTDARSDRISRA